MKTAVARRGREEGSAEVEDAASLHAKQDILREQEAALRAELAAEEARAPGRSGAGVAAAQAADPAQPAEDSLDAFMSGVGRTIDSDRIVSLKAQLAELEAQVARAKRLLALADPDG